MPVVQCPNCDKKMNLREPRPGKSLKCPGCQEPFVPVPAKRGGGRPRKKKAAPTDDFGDDEYDEPAPRRSSKGAGKKGAAKGKKKGAAGAKKSKMPLFLGIGVLAVALAGGVGFMLMSSSGDAGGADAADGNADADADGTEAANMAELEGEDGGGGHDSEGGPDSAAAAMAGSQPQGSSADGSSVSGNTPASTAVAAGNINLQYLPAKTEGLLHIDLDRLLTGPVGQLLNSPFVTAPLQQFRDKSGLGPKDIKSVTVGIAGVSEVVASGAPPSPEQLPIVGVIRTKIAVDAAKIQAAIPGAQSATAGSTNYIKIPANPPAALWFANSSTAVFGVESMVLQAAGSASAPTSIDSELLDGKSVIQAVFSPADPAIFQHPKLQVPPQSPPGTKATVDAIRQHATAVGIGFDLTNDIAFSMSTRCRDSAGAQAMAAAFTQANVENKAQTEALANSPQAQMMGPMIEITKQMGDSSKIEAVGTICRSSASAAGGGEQLVNFVPIMIGQAMAQGFSQGRSIGQGIRGENNLKQIALAMHNFHGAYSRFPNAAPQSPTGEKWLSWRVHLLPFLGQQSLYDQFKLEEPWDSPTNRPLADQMPDVFRSPNASSVPPGKTLFQVPIGAGTAFENAKGLGMRDFTDGTSNTILVVEVSPDRAVYWTQPEDFQFNAANPMDGLGGVEADGFKAAFADGKVTTIPSSTDAATVKGIFTRNGAEAVQGNF